MCVVLAVLHGAVQVYTSMVQCECEELCGLVPVPWWWGCNVFGTVVSNLSLPFVTSRKGNEASLPALNC